MSVVGALRRYGLRSATVSSTQIPALVLSTAGPARCQDRPRARRPTRPRRGARAPVAGGLKALQVAGGFVLLLGLVLGCPAVLRHGRRPPRRRGRRGRAQLRQAAQAATAEPTRRDKTTPRPGGSFRVRPDGPAMERRGVPISARSSTARRACAPWPWPCAITSSEPGAPLRPRGFVCAKTPPRARSSSSAHEARPWPAVVDFAAGGLATLTPSRSAARPSRSLLLRCRLRARRGPAPPRRA